MKSQKLFTGKWVQTKHLEFSDPTQPKLRRSQEAAFHTLKDKKHVILKAPTGWGKSMVIAFLILYKLMKYPKLKCIISVPQTIIGSNFTKDWKIKIGRRVIQWIINNNLCHVEAVHTINHLVAFLNNAHDTLGDRILICTHATLAHTYKKLKNNRQLALLDNTMLWIDEGHHLMNAQVVGGGTISNALGALVKHCLETGNYVGLATATYGRHDRCHIIPEDLERRFTQVHIPYDAYFEEAQPVATFEFNIICGEFSEALDPLFKKMRPTVLYLAKRNSLYATRCKYTEVRQIITLLSKRLKQEAHHTETVIHIGSLKVLDLVTEKGRRKRREYLDNGGEVDMILALDTCKEGFDWPKAERCIIMGERHSIPEMIQMIGRLFRRSPGKTHAEVFQVMPAVVQDKKVFKDWRNSILTVIFSAMLLEDVFVPSPISGVSHKKTRARNSLADLIPDTDVAQSLIRDFIVAVHQGNNYERSWRLAPSILKKYGIPKTHWEIVWKKLWTRMSILNSRMKKLKLDTPFELLKGVDMVDGLLMLTSGLCGKMTFEELRRVIGRQTKTLEEWVIIAENLAAQNIQEAA